jgi:multidrug transporter EmrE-like cation transporter
MTRPFYFSATWTIVVGAIIPAVWFLATCRPTRWGRAAQVDASAWVVVILGFYVLAVFGLIAGARQPSTPVAIAYLLWRLVGAAVLWHRAIRWRIIRSTLARPSERDSADT